MNKDFDIQEYMTKGVERVVSDAIRATLKNPKESAFMVRFAAASRKASRKRADAEAAGNHIPPLLIASITSACNLHCEGCYARGINSTTDEVPVAQLTADDWSRIFEDAADLGFSFVILVGGEPMLRRDVIEAAGNTPNVLFPIFTNGTFITDNDIKLFDKCRNLVPVVSIEGGQEATDARRGSGVYDRLSGNLDSFKSKGIVFGASITVTSENMGDVTSDEFLAELADKGCKSVIYIEYVPPTCHSEELALNDEGSARLLKKVGELRESHPEMVFVSFPGDEKNSGGCVAAGRGLLHINSHGGAEPCPFSPYSDINVRERSLAEALQSDFFKALRSSDILTEAHTGGCVLHEKSQQVEALLAGKSI